jgi:hypothetical protein
VKTFFSTWSVVLVLVAFVDSPSAHAYDATEFVAPPGKAVVVFVQNQKVDRSMTFTVFESDKRCVAEVGGREAQVLPLEPEPLIFYVLGYNKTRRIEIFPQAGRTYFVRLHTVDKPMGPAPEVTLVRRASEEHKLLKFWLDGAIITHSIGDDRCYGKPMNERKNRTQRRLNEGNADWKNGDDVYRDKYMLIEKDGLTAQDIGLL